MKCVGKNPYKGLHYYDKVTPASKLDIFKWLISGGRFGRLYYVETKLTPMMPPQHFNCMSKVDL